jgi:SsrA-binding protein
MAGGKQDKKPTIKVVARNRKAGFEYEIIERLEAGLVLTGTEVKTLRTGKVSIEEAYVKIQGEEAFLVGCHIEEYLFGNRLNHEPKRRRKLLLHAHQIEKWSTLSGEKGYTIIPLQMYFNDANRAKIEIALGRGKKLHDKRQDQRKQESKREIRGMLGRRR